MLMLVIVMVIVMILVAKNWQAVAPTAATIDPGDGDYPVIIDVDDRGQAAAGEAIRDGHLPDLSDMRDATGAHAAAVQDALEQID